ncbi:MAG: hypothetical protein RLZZ124_1568, partial [Cyanobacteriota bacterium]
MPQPADCEAEVLVEALVDVLVDVLVIGAGPAALSIA